MRTIIAGSRTATAEQVRQAINSCPWRSEITGVVSGIARGADELGLQWAKEQNLPVCTYSPDWAAQGKAAGPIRNSLMAENADALILVWDGSSSGSRDMLSKAKKRGLKIWEYRFKDLVETAGTRAGDNLTFSVGRFTTTFYGFVQADAISPRTR